MPENSQETRGMAEQAVQSAVLTCAMQMQCVTQDMHGSVQAIITAYTMKMVFLIQECQTIEEVHNLLATPLAAMRWDELPAGVTRGE